MPKTKTAARRFTTGIFGMNLRGIPFEAESEGFWLAILLSACASGAVFLFVRRLGGRD